MFSLCLFVCLLATLGLLKKFLTNFYEIFRIAQNDTENNWLNFGNDLAHPLDAVQENVKCCISDNWGNERPPKRAV